MTTATEDGTRMYAVCVDRETGRIVYDNKLFDVSDPDPLGNEVNTYASPSPVMTNTVSSGCTIFTPVANAGARP